MKLVFHQVPVLAEHELDGAEVCDGRGDRQREPQRQEEEGEAGLPPGRWNRQDEADGGQEDGPEQKVCEHRSLDRRNLGFEFLPLLLPAQRLGLNFEVEIEVVIRGPGFDARHEGDGARKRRKAAPKNVGVILNDIRNFTRCQQKIF